MKITVDTKQDSVEDIKKVMQLLNMLLEGKDIETVGEVSTESASALSTLFNDDNKDENEEKEEALPGVMTY